MHRLVLSVLAVVTLPAAAAAQTYGQPYYGGSAVTHGHDSHSSYGRYGQAYAGAYGDPRAYRPPTADGYPPHDRGGRYGYSSRRSGQWSRWSSPPGRGYHDVYGYNDDRAPGGADHRRRLQDCYCGVGAYLYDR